jgi:DNA modification methylase
MLGEYKLNEIYNKDSLEFLKERADYEFDINYSDPPYALGSEVIIRPDGKVDYKKANDFMNKWEMPTGTYWEQWFKEAYRTLKHGGYLIMFGMDRQLLLFKYYANLAGFTEQQSLYWYFISNFPKATDLSKMIDKNASATREVVGKSNRHGGGIKGNETSYRVPEEIPNITAPSTELAKKYEGYKYSISPLKQTNETILVFLKPYKTGSCLHDTLAYENGDDTCCCGALDIDGNRVEPLNEKDNQNRKVGFTGQKFNGTTMLASSTQTQQTNLDLGRYPSQTFCDSNTAEVLDKQSGILKSGAKKSNQNQYNGNGKEFITNLGASVREYKKSEGGCSKILHKCDFEENEHDLYFYNPKVSKSERNAGCDELPIKDRVFNGTSDTSSQDIKDVEARFTTSPSNNNHPTLKPIKLNERILKLFKTPNEQKIIYPFAGSGSEIIGGVKAGFTNWVGCEINPDYVEIAKARIDYWSNKFDDGLDEIVVEKEIDKSQISLFDLMEG